MLSWSLFQCKFCKLAEMKFCRTWDRLDILVWFYFKLPSVLVKESSNTSKKEKDDPKSQVGQNDEGTSDKKEAKKSGSAEKEAVAAVTMEPKRCSKMDYERFKKNLLQYHCVRIGNTDCDKGSSGTFTSTFLIMSVITWPAPVFTGGKQHFWTCQDNEASWWASRSRQYSAELAARPTDLRCMGANKEFGKSAQC